MKPTSIRIVMGIWYPKINSANPMLIKHGERGLLYRHDLIINKCEVVTYEKFKKVKPQLINPLKYTTTTTY